MQLKKTDSKKILIFILLFSFIFLNFAFPASVKADNYYSTWSDYKSANNISDFTWNDVVDAMESALDEAISVNKSGDHTASYKVVSDVKNNYWGASGMKIEMNQKLPAINKSTVAADFKALGNAIRDGEDDDAVTTAKDVLIADLRLSANKLDGVEIKRDILEETESSATALFNEKYYETWADYTAAAGMSESVTKWNDVADAMSEVFRLAKEKFAEGDSKTAYDYINDGYYGYYETTGFERNTMGYISGARKSEVELQFSACKTMSKSGTIDEFNEEVDVLRTMIRTDANKLDGVDEEGNETGTRSAAAATFIACFTIILREGFEAILVVGAIIAYLLKTTEKSEEERKRQLRPVYIGAILGIVLSFVSAWALNLLKLANSASQEVIEGVTALIAVVVLFWVSNWMVSKSESEAWDAYIKKQIGSASKKGSSFALAFTAFLAVYREGAEVILFYQPLLNGNNINMVWIGFIVGAVCLVFVYLAIRFLSFRLPLKPFFLATSILMAIMSIAFLGSGIKELIEGDVIQMTSPPWVAWIPSNSILEILGIYPCVQTVVPQIILTIITVITFIFWLKKNKKLKEEVKAAK